MPEQVESVRLNRAQSSYLEQLQTAEGLPPGLDLRGLVLSGTTDAIEALRDKLTDILAARGFDEEYSATDEGGLIEDLIDALFLA
jgi:hypothetical protein